MRSLLPAITLSVLVAGSLVSPTARAEDASVKTRLDARGIKFQVDEDGDYRVAYNYETDKRTQLVFVSGKTEQVEGFTVREVFSPAARIQKDGIDGAKALELMAESRLNKLGSWEINGDILYFVIKLPESVDAARLEAAMDLAAQTADDMELKLSGDRDDL